MRVKLVAVVLLLLSGLALSASARVVTLAVPADTEYRRAVDRCVAEGKTEFSTDRRARRDYVVWRLEQSGKTVSVTKANRFWRITAK